jgi:ParB/RepB/Spo0J family partition protein
MEAVKPTSLKVEDIHVDLVMPNPDNINEMDEKTFGFLLENIKEVGLIDPIQVIPIQDGKYFLMGGEHRWKAAKQLGYNYVPAVILTDTRWTDSDYTDLISFRMNVLRGTQQPEKFLKVYDRMATKFGQEKLQEVFQIADKVLWKRLTKNLTKGMKEQGVPAEVVSTIEQASDKSKSFDSFNKKLTKILNDYQSNQSALGTVVFQEQKAIIVQTTQTVWELIDKVTKIASLTGKSFSELMQPSLEKVVQEYSHAIASQTDTPGGEASDQSPS